MSEHAPLQRGGEQTERSESGDVLIEAAFVQMIHEELIRMRSVVEALLTELHYGMASGHVGQECLDIVSRLRMEVQMAVGGIESSGVAIISDEGEGDESTQRMVKSVRLALDDIVASVTQLDSLLKDGYHGMIETQSVEVRELAATIRSSIGLAINAIDHTRTY